MNSYQRKSLENKTLVAASHKSDSNSAAQLIDNRAPSTFQMKAMDKNPGCGCAACFGANQLKLTNQVQLKQISQTGKVAQLCQHNHPEHAAIPVCPYGLKDAAFRIPPKHVKGASKSKFSEGSQAVMDHAYAQLSAGRAIVESINANGGNDIQVSVERAHRHHVELPRRRFNVHKGSNITASGQMAHDFFLSNGEASESESSDSEEEKMEEKKGE